MKDIITNALKQELEPLPYVHAFWLEGSDALGTDDEYSDLDYWVDFSDEYEEETILAVENALASVAEIDYKYIMHHNHPKIRQRIYHLKGTSPYLMIDFCWQLNSRSKDEYVYYKDNKIESAGVIFDKDGIVRFKEYNEAEIDIDYYALEEMKYRMTQLVRVEKYVRREQFPEAMIYYMRYALEPVVHMLRLKYTPAYTDMGFVHISNNIPEAEAERFSELMKVTGVSDIEANLPILRKWFDELLLEIN